MELLRLLVVGGGVVEGAGTEEEVSVMEEKGFRHEWVGVADDCWLGRSFLFLFFFFCNMWDLSSLIRDQTCTPCLGSTEFKPLHCQQSPSFPLLLPSELLFIL